MPKVNSWIGSAVKRLEDLRFVTGSGSYVGDLARPNLAYAALRRSSSSHARILKVDTEVAAASLGVIGIVTAADLTVVPKIPLRMEPRPELARFEQTVVAIEKVRYVGEPIAVVVAETLAAAEEAASRVEVELEDLPPLTNARIAMESQNHLFEEHQTNLAMTLRGALGDADSAFVSADYVKSTMFRVHRHAANPMEPRGLLAEWDEEQAKLTVHGCCKVPFAVRRLLASHLGLEQSSIDVIESDVGGGFGVRGEYYPEDFLIPFAARRFKRPLKWLETRQEHLLATTHAREVDIELEIACRKDGAIIALRGNACMDMGAYIRPNAVTAPRNIAQVISGPYHVPNVDMSVAMVMTNKTPSGSYRGPGRFEADFARERLFDIAANDLGIDSVEFRRKNLISSCEMPYTLPKVLPYGSGTACDSGDYGAALERCLVEIDWPRIKSFAGACVAGKYHGVGVGCYIEGGGSGPEENARLSINANGNVAVFVGSSALGQGLETVFAQVAADALEISMEKIEGVFHGSTIYVSEGFGSYASRSVVMGGNAIVAAADALRSAIRLRAAARLECLADDVVLDGIESAHYRQRTVLVLDIIGDNLSATGAFSSRERTYSYGTHAAHISVDPETGEIEILDYVAVEDVGRIMNPATLHGQAHGAIVQGLGGALFEELKYDGNGQLVTGSLMDYALPIAGAFPCVRVITTEDWPSPHNPLGAKGAGEGGIIPVAGVIGNAVASALRSLAVEPYELPLSPYRIWSLLQKRSLGADEREPIGSCRS